MQQRELNMNWGGFKPSGREGGKAAGKAPMPGRTVKKSSKGKAGAAGGGGGGGGDSGGDDKTVMNLAYVLMAYMAYSFLSDVYSDGMGRVEKIDYQTFRNDILARDVVDKVCATLL
jgi:hypothetical protein